MRKKTGEVRVWGRVNLCKKSKYKRSSTNDPDPEPEQT